MTHATAISARHGSAKRRPLRRALAAAAALLVTALSGCMKIDMDLTIKDDSVSGAVILAFDRQLLTLTGQSEEQLLASLDRENSLPEGEGVTTEPYRDDTFIGNRYVLTDVTLAKFSDAGSDPDSLRITHDTQAGRYRVTGAMDFSDVEEVPPAMSGLLDSLEVKISITFPGEVIRHTGELDGTTVTWQPKMGERTVIEAEAKDSSGSWSAALVIGGALLLALLVVVMVVFALLRRRTAAPAATSAQEAPAVPEQAYQGPGLPAAGPGDAGYPGGAGSADPSARRG